MAKGSYTVLDKGQSYNPSFAMPINDAAYFESYQLAVNTAKTAQDSGSNKSHNYLGLLLEVRLLSTENVNFGKDSNGNDIIKEKQVGSYLLLIQPDGSVLEIGAEAVLDVIGPGFSRTENTVTLTLGNVEIGLEAPVSGNSIAEAILAIKHNTVSQGDGIIVEGPIDNVFTVKLDPETSISENPSIIKAPTSAAVKSYVDNVESKLDVKVSTAFHAAGSDTATNLNNKVLTEAMIGEVWNVSEDGLFNTHLAEEFQFTAIQGDNVAVVKKVDGVIIWDKLAATIIHYANGVTRTPDSTETIEEALINLENSVENISVSMNSKDSSVIITPSEGMSFDLSVPINLITNAEIDTLFS